jgi:hypothetical protein
MQSVDEPARNARDQTFEVGLGRLVDTRELCQTDRERRRAAPASASRRFQPAQITPWSWPVTVN